MKVGDLVRYNCNFLVAESGQLGIVTRMFKSKKLIEVVWMDPPGFKQWFSSDLLEVIK